MPVLLRPSSFVYRRRQRLIGYVSNLQLEEHYGREGAKDAETITDGMITSMLTLAAVFSPSDLGIYTKAIRLSLPGPRAMGRSGSPHSSTC
jgi:hypothetical protein